SRCRSTAAAVLLATLTAFATSCAQLTHHTVDALPPNLKERVQVLDAEPEPRADEKTAGVRKQLVIRPRRSITTEAESGRGLLVVPLVESAPGRSWGTPGLTRSPWRDEPDEVNF